MSIDRWVNAVLPRLPSASKDVVELEIVQAVDNFCRESTAWRDMLYGFNVEAGVREIPVYHGLSGEDATIIQILRVYFSRHQLTPYSHVPWEQTSNHPQGWTTKPNDTSTVMLSTIPTESMEGELDVWVALTPVDITSGTADFNLLYNDFWEIILDGVLGRLYSHPNKPYSDTAAAGYHLKRYRSGTRLARDKANRGYTGNAQNWTFPSFGR